MGTQRLHHFQPMSTSTLRVKRFSSSDTFQIKKGCNSGQILQDEHINGYVTVVYDNTWWLGYVIDKNTEEKTVSVNFLTPRGPSPSFKYPERQDILNVPSVLWNRNYLLWFRFWLLKSYGSGSGSNFWKVMFPVPAPYLDYKKQILQKKFWISFWLFT